MFNIGDIVWFMGYQWQICDIARGGAYALSRRSSDGKKCKGGLQVGWNFNPQRWDDVVSYGFTKSGKPDPKCKYPFNPDFYGYVSRSHIAKTWEEA